MFVIKTTAASDTEIGPILHVIEAKSFHYIVKPTVGGESFYIRKNTVRKLTVFSFRVDKEQFELVKRYTTFTTLRLSASKTNCKNVDGIRISKEPIILNLYCNRASGSEHVYCLLIEANKCLEIASTIQIRGIDGGYMGEKHIKHPIVKLVCGPKILEK